MVRLRRPDLKRTMTVHLFCEDFAQALRYWCPIRSAGPLPTGIRLHSGGPVGSPQLSVGRGCLAGTSSGDGLSLLVLVA